MDKTTCLISVCSYLRKCELAAFDELCWLVSNQMADQIFCLWNWGTASIVLKYGRLNMEPACLGCLPAGRSGNIIISSNHVFGKEITGAERKNRILWEFTLLCFHMQNSHSWCSRTRWLELKTKDKKKTLSIFGSKYMLCKFQKCLSSCYENSVLVLKKIISFVLYWFAI